MGLFYELSAANVFGVLLGTFIGIILQMAGLPGDCPRFIVCFYSYFSHCLPSRQIMLWKSFILPRKPVKKSEDIRFVDNHNTVTCHPLYCLFRYQLIHVGNRRFVYKPEYVRIKHRNRTRHIFSETSFFPSEYPYTALHITEGMTVAPLVY